MAAKAINDHQFSVHAMPQWALMVFHSKLWELSLMACFARWTFNVNASEAAPGQTLTHIAARPEINLKYCKRDASIIERI